MLAELADRLPLAAAHRPAEEAVTASADESLAIAKGRAKVADPPDWFGVIKPSRLLGSSAGPGTRATDAELRLEFDPLEMPDADDDDEGEPTSESKILKLFEAPISSLANRLGLPPQAARRFARRRGDEFAGGELKVRSVRRAQVRRTGRPPASHANPSSPTTTAPARQLASAVRCTRSGTFTTIDIGRTGAGCSTSR